jgi:hypothetical protein
MISPINEAHYLTLTAEPNLTTKDKNSIRQPFLNSLSKTLKICLGDVLLRRRFVTGDVSLRRRFVKEMLCV